MGHAYNYGLVTSMKGATWEAIRLVCTDGSGTLVIAEDCGAGLFSGVTRNAQGDYTLQMSVPYPPKIVVGSPEAACATKTTAALTVRMKVAGYSATAGTLQFFVSNSAGTSAADPANGDEIHILLNFRRYTANP